MATALLACLPSMASSLATSLVCCCSSAACSVCTKTAKLSSSTATRFAYAVLFLGVTIFAWTMETGWLEQLLQKIPYYSVHCPDDRCAGAPAIFRVFMALVVFHLIMALLLIGVKNSRDGRAGLQNGWWGPKIVFWFGLTIAFFFTPNQAFHHYGNIAFAGAVGFIFIQLVLLLDFAGHWSESWVGQYETTEDRKWAIGLAVCSIGMLVSVFICIILFFVYFGSNDGCGLNNFFVSFHLIFSIAVTVLSVHPKIQEHKPSSGLLQPAVVAFYGTYLVGSALIGEPKADDYDCNPFNSDGARTTAAIAGTVITFISIVYSTTRAAANSKALMASDAAVTHSSAADAVALMEKTGAVQTQPTEMTNPVAGESTEDAAARRRRLLEQAVEEGGLPKSAMLEDEADDGLPKMAENDDESEVCSYNYSYFHIVFALASMYMSMLLSQWNTVDPETGVLVAVGHDWTSVWVKIVSSWAAFVLFTWTLFAPILLPNREWN